MSSFCTAGYYCKSGAKDDMPTTTTNFTACVGYDECAGLCPVGHYCPDATVTPEPCPERTYRNNTGATQETDCDQCPAGYMCNNGKSVLIVLLAMDI